MPLSQLENELRLLARSHIQDGTLPDVLPSRTWGGNGNGDPCAVCGKFIPDTEMEYEIEGGQDGNRRTYHLHFLCHAGWQLECARAQRLKQTSQES